MPPSCEYRLTLKGILYLQIFRSNAADAIIQEIVQGGESDDGDDTVAHETGPEIRSIFADFLSK